MIDTEQVVFTFFKSTDVQRTWRKFGWTPPSEDETVRERWRYFKTLDTEQQEAESCNQ